MNKQILLCRELTLMGLQRKYSTQEDAKHDSKSLLVDIIQKTLPMWEYSGRKYMHASDKERIFLLVRILILVFLWFKATIFEISRSTADQPPLYLLILSGASRPGNWTPFDWSDERGSVIKITSSIHTYINTYIHTYPLFKHDMV